MKKKNRIFFIMTSLLLYGCFDSSGFLSKYQSLYLGMTLGEAKEIYDVPFEPVFIWNDFEVFYVQTPSVANAEGLSDEARVAVDTLKQLPDSYGFVQLAFDQNQRLIAFTWIGEAYSVVHLGGEKSGSNISLLDNQGLEEWSDMQN